MGLKGVEAMMLSTPQIPAAAIFLSPAAVRKQSGEARKRTLDPDHQMLMLH
jgi:hypothetical protein